MKSNFMFVHSIRNVTSMRTVYNIYFVICFDLLPTISLVSKSSTHLHKKNLFSCILYGITLNAKEKKLLNKDYCF